jgi:capsular exopolysaccharide synthesis family protein
MATVAFAVVALGVVWIIPSRYVANAVLIIGNREPSEPAIPLTPVSGLTSPPDAITIQTEADVIRSRALIGKVVNRLKLGEMHEFNPDEENPSKGGLIESGYEAVRAAITETIAPHIWKALVGLLSFTGPSPSAADGSREAQIIDAVLSRLRVSPNPNSRVIVIEFVSANANTTAAVANAIADEYLIEQATLRARRLEEVGEWLNSRVAELREQVEKSQQAVETFRVQHGLVSDATGKPLLLGRIGEIDTQLTRAEGERAGARARLDRFKSLQISPGGVEATDDVLRSPTLQVLQKQLVDLEGQRSRLLADYLPNHPKVMALQAEIDTVRAKFHGEQAKIVHSLETEASIANTKVTLLRQQEESLERQMDVSGQAAITMRALKRDAEVNEKLLDAFTTRVREGQDAKLVYGQQARLISHADVPTLPTKPTKSVLAVVGVAASFVAAAMLGLALDRSDPTFRNSEEIEPELGVRVLGHVPRSRSLRKPLEPFPEGMLSAPAEAIRAIYINLRFFGLATRVPTALLFTSAQPREGKTTLVLNFAHLAARCGQKVLVIDADFRRGSISKLLGFERRRGLAELLTCDIGLEEAIIDTGSGPHCLPSGQAKAIPAALPEIERLADLIPRLKREYDLILLDSPPVLVVSDPLVISPHVDATIFVTRWGATARKAARYAVHRLSASGCMIAGVALTMVEGHRHERYYYGDSSRYTNAIRNYSS